MHRTIPWQADEAEDKGYRYTLGAASSSFLDSLEQALEALLVSGNLRSSELVAHSDSIRKPFALITSLFDKRDHLFEVIFEEVLHETGRYSGA